MGNNMLSLFQLCDSNFPTGAFSHSYGLESYIQEDQVHDQATFPSGFMRMSMSSSSIQMGLLLDLFMKH